MHSRKPHTPTRISIRCRLIARPFQSYATHSSAGTFTCWATYDTAGTGICPASSGNRASKNFGNSANPNRFARGLFSSEAPGPDLVGPGRAPQRVSGVSP